MSLGAGIGLLLNWAGRPGLGRHRHRGERGHRRQGNRGPFPQAPADARGPVDRVLADHRHHGHGRPSDPGLARRAGDRLLSHDELPCDRHRCHRRECDSTRATVQNSPCSKKAPPRAGCSPRSQGGLGIVLWEQLESLIPKNPLAAATEGRHAPCDFLLAPARRGSSASPSTVRTPRTRGVVRQFFSRPLRRDDADDALRGEVRPDRCVRFHLVRGRRQGTGRVSGAWLVRPHRLHRAPQFTPR